ncbi:helix-turn-helix domain-containing protein [Pedobacter africanus]|uniref:AraC-like DNA-binding protein n=2 Tax=Pedobacter africanus TaxID=151894 RepID=A0ACC6L0N2_9SPHI|nr:helix-turn-helix domain-containing protein [Pedobacter africanus]MDR6784985.1 AraC-like DNA-binding protein [Pedobacter africanus]
MMCFSAGACFLLSFLMFFHPLRQNLVANRWLALFVLTMGTAFLGISLETTALSNLQFILPPALYLGTRYFVEPLLVFKKKHWLHFLPYLVCLIFQAIWATTGRDFITAILFETGNFKFLVRDLLPFQFLAYITISYQILIVHKRNLKLITAAVKEIDLDWLRYFLVILAVISIFWINDAVFGFAVLLKIMPVIYTGAVFFLAYFSMRQVAVFAFSNAELEEISDLLEHPLPDDKQKTARLSDKQLAVLSKKLDELMVEGQIFLNNDLSLPSLANQLGVSIHDTSYLINKLTGGNFYNFINQLRVEEAKKLLMAGRIEELNMVGIAFAAGFNSKTAFNTAFKKYTGCSPTAYIKQQSSN